MFVYLCLLVCSTHNIINNRAIGSFDNPYHKRHF